MSKSAPSSRLKRGDTRDDGRVFWSYNRDSRNGERWYSSDRFTLEMRRLQERQRATKEAKREYDRVRRLTKLEAIREYDRIRYATNPLPKQIASRKRYTDNPKAARARNKVWTSRNKERVSAWWREYYKQKPEKFSVQRARRRAVAAGAYSKASPDERALIESLYATSRRLTQITGEPHEVDHILPLSPPEGFPKGTHTSNNLQVLPKELNRSKGNNPLFLLPEGYRRPIFTKEGDRYVLVAIA